MAYVKYNVQGNTWGVTCFELVIPENSIKDMTADEIGKHVLSLIAKIKEVRDEEEGEQPIRPARNMDSRVYQNLVNRDGERCQVPGCDCTNLDIDHIIPRSKGGSNRQSNLQLLCLSHNQDKGTKDWEQYLESLKGQPQ